MHERPLPTQGRPLSSTVRPQNTMQQLEYNTFKKRLFARDAAYKSFREVDIRKMYAEKHPLSLDTDPPNSAFSTDDDPTASVQRPRSTTEIELLQQLVSINQKQLYWTRIIGVIVLGAWIATQLYSCSRQP